MGKHKEWRKIAKKERRRRLRIMKARSQERSFNQSSEKFEIFFQEQQMLKNFEEEQIIISNMKENKKWEEAEKLATMQWNILQEKKKRAIQEYLLQEEKLKMEWEMEQKRKKEEEEKLKLIEEEKKRKHDVFISKLEQFLSGDSTEPPTELLYSHETRPNVEACPFFFKTACCRFGDLCSRNHKYPGISKVLLAPNFFAHFGLSNSNYNEYDTDVMLEYEDSDTYCEFVEFFEDVLPEFEKFGRLTQFTVCNNYEKHLRGNTYIEYDELRCAVAAYQSLNSRWYGGKQISLQFCLVDSWKNAICGLASRRRCPKGRACNFLHVFKNPRRLFEDNIVERKRCTRNWRWSESPERYERKPERRWSSERSRESRDRSSKYYKDSGSSSYRHSSRSSRRNKTHT